MIFMYSGATIPSNYMLCDGRELLKTAYPQLFNAIGITYGESADKLKFKIPDLRGRFVRCVGGNAAALGGVQGDAIRNIAGSAVGFRQNWVDRYNGPYSSSGVFGLVGTGNTKDGGTIDTSQSYLNLTFNASRVVPTANENRPVNMSMNFIIQVKE